MPITFKFRFSMDRHASCKTMAHVAIWAFYFGILFSPAHATALETGVPYEEDNTSAEVNASIPYAIEQGLCDQKNRAVLKGEICTGHYPTSRESELVDGNAENACEDAVADAFFSLQISNILCPKRCPVQDMEMVVTDIREIGAPIVMDIQGVSETTVAYAVDAKYYFTCSSPNRFYYDDNIYVNVTPSYPKSYSRPFPLYSSPAGSTSSSSSYYSCSGGLC